MRGNLPFRYTIFAAFGSVFVATWLVAAPQQQAPAGQVRTAEEQFKNIQVLKGTPASQLNLSMHFIEGALGVDCEYCHVEGDRAKDDLEPKRTARKMMTMMFEINKNSFDGKQVVTCNTCHNGHPKPSAAPVLPETTGYVPPYGIEPQPPPALPTADQILAKYVQALGGEQAIRKITSRVITATRDIPAGPGGSVPAPAQTEIYQRAPNLLLNINRAPAYTVSDGYDGAVAWAQTPNGVVADAVDPDQGRAKRSANLYEPLDLKREYTRMEVQSVEQVNKRDAYLVVGFPQGDAPEKLYFDTRSGLLLRKMTVIPTLFGDFPFETDYDDYKDTGSGVKIPFVTRMVPAFARGVFVSRSTIRVLKVQDNAPIDSSKFTKPASKPQPPPAQQPARP